MQKIFGQPLFLRNLARAASLIVNAYFAVILFLLASNEDKPQTAAVPVIYLLILTMMSVFVAWRWEKAGAIVMTVESVGLSIVAYISAQSAGLSNFIFLAVGLYGFPFLILSGLFLISHTTQLKNLKELWND